MDDSGCIGTLPPGATVVPLEIAALPASLLAIVAPRTLARMCARGVVVCERRPGKTDRRGVNHGRWLLALRDNGLPIYRPAPARSFARAPHRRRSTKKRARPARRK